MQPVECLPGCPGILCASWEVFVSTDVNSGVQGPSRSLHSSKRAVFNVVLMGLVHVIKLFRDLRRGTIPRCPLSGYLSSVACRVRSVRLATALLMSDDSGVFGQTVGICRLQTSCDHSTGLIQCRVQLLCMVERSHAGQAYSAAE